MANATAPPTLPNDAKLIALMLAARGIQDADERVLHQLLDFAHRYTCDILQDAQSFADHANRPGRVETSDVELAVQARSGWEFTEAAPKDYLLPIARELNKIPLPTLSAAYSHIALPDPHLMLGAPNFRLVPRYPAPESLGLFRTGDVADDEEDDEEDEDDEEEGDDDDHGESEEEGRVESEKMDDDGDNDDDEEDNDGPVRAEQAREKDNDGNDDDDNDRMAVSSPSTTAVGGATTPAPPPPAVTATTTTAAVADETSVNGIKRRLEEDDDYDASA